ncbi:MAG: class I SAM-dependent methyltransferase [Anaerolineae bacterium]|nr:class I SAM-dependent methyltransferase [Anaerolineae bacterium]
MSDQTTEQPSPTARESSGILGLGRSSGQRSAEMLAGVRAELMPKPEYLAMVRPAGRVIAGLLLRLARGDQARIHIVSARPEAFRYLIMQALQGKEEACYVELASGYLPRAWQIASEFPRIEVTEIDLPEVIAEKQRRFARANLAIPPNLRMLSADLGVKPLAEVLENRKADVITAEGLLSYFTLEVVQQVAIGVRQSLKPNGVFIADILTRANAIALGLSKGRQAVSLFRRNAGQWLGIVDDYNHARRLFEAAGYSKVEMYEIPELAERLPHVPKPVGNAGTIVVAHNQSS